MSEKVKYPFLDFLKISLISFIVPLYICLLIFLLFEFIVMELFQFSTIFHILSLAILFLGLYYLYLILLIEFVALWVRKWNKRSPPQQGVFKRELDDFSKPEAIMLKYYHKRGFIIKFPIWLSSKSPFPWLVNRALRRIGHNKLSNNVIYCDAYVGLEFTIIGDNTFFYPTSTISSHAVNSIFGKISIIKIIFGNNTIFYPGVVAGPGVITLDKNTFLPNSVLPKNWRSKIEEAQFQGSPARRIPVKDE